MNNFNKSLLAAFLSTALLLPSKSQAMPIWQFDKMAQDDQAKYVSELISGAEKALTDESRTDLAAQVEHLFTTNPADSNASIGMNDFMITLAKARLADAERALKDPDAKRVQVEDAMAVMLKNLHGIDLPAGFMHVGDNFHPKSSFMIKNPDGTITVQARPQAGDGRDANGKGGLVIPAQVIVPITSIPEKK